MPGAGGLRYVARAIKRTTATYAEVVRGLSGVSDISYDTVVARPNLNTPREMRLSPG